MAGRGTWLRRASACALAAVAIAAAVGVPAGAATKADVQLLFDTPGSMGGALDGAKEQMIGVQERLRAEIPDVQFAVAEMKDYYSDSVPGYGDEGDFPWKLHQSVTGDPAKVQAAIDPLEADGGNDSPEAYAGALEQADLDSAVGWRSGARRLVVLIADDMPHDLDLNEGIPEDTPWYQDSPFDTGVDPGKDQQAGTADDIDWQPLLGRLKDHGIPLLYVHFNGDPGYLPYWKIWAAITGGTAAMAGESDLGDTIVDLVEHGVQTELPACDAGEVRDADGRCGPPPPPEKKCLPGDQIGDDGECHTQPVIFMPGIMGSEIWCGDKKLWMAYRFGTGISHKEMLLASDGFSPRDPGDDCNRNAGPVDGDIVRSFAGQDVYGEDVDNLAKFFGSKLYVFSYDWRKAPAIAADRLDAFVARVQAANHGVKVRIVAHSMGGLVTQSFVNLPARAARVAAVVTIGTPYWGSPKSILPVARGDTGIGFDPLDALLDNDEIKDLSSNMTGLYHLFPSNSFHANHGGWLTMSEDSKTPIATADATAVAMDRKWSQTNVGLYRQAISAHAGILDGFRTNGVRYLAIVGAGEETLMDVEFDDDLFRDDWKWGYDDGDGTVPLLSAAQGRTSAPPLGENVPRWYQCHVGHADLSGDVDVQVDAINWLMGWRDVPGELSPTPCGASGYELGLRSGPPVAGGAAAAARKAMKVTVIAGGKRHSLDDAINAGLVDAIQRDADQVVLVTNTARPVSVEVSGRWVSATVRPLAGAKEGAPKAYGPVTGKLTVTRAKVLRGKKALKPSRDKAGPRTRVKVVRKGRGAILRIKARDRSGVAATMAAVGKRKAKLVRRGRLRIAKVGAKGVRVRYQSIDVLGNREMVRTLRLRR
jgi:hypothetical protein